MNIDPPAYAHTTTTRQRTINDLRQQIIANGTILRPRFNDKQPADEHIEIVVAQIPSQSGIPTITLNEKQATISKTPPAGLSRPVANDHVPNPATSADTGRHYALLVRRSYTTKDLRIILKGEPRDTVEEALEWLLEQTEGMVHEVAVKYGKEDKGTDCCIM